MKNLKKELHMLSEAEMKAMRGGLEQEPPAWEVDLPEVTVRPDPGSPAGDSTYSFGWSYPANGFNQSGNGAYGGGNNAMPPGFGWNQATGIWTNPSAGAPSIIDGISLALSHASAWVEFYDVGYGTKTLDSVVTEVFSNPKSSLIADLQTLKTGEFKGLAVVSLAGKVLGITSAASSIGVLAADIYDGNGINPVNVADAVISVGSLFVKSNVVGFAVSLGWLLIKGQFEPATATPPS